MIGKHMELAGKGKDLKAFKLKSIAGLSNVKMYDKKHKLLKYIMQYYEREK